MRHLQYFLIGSAIIVLGFFGILLLKITLDSLWAMYTEDYFYAVNRAILALGVAVVAWKVGKEFVAWKSRT